MGNAKMEKIIDKILKEVKDELFSMTYMSELGKNRIAYRLSEFKRQLTDFWYYNSGKGLWRGNGLNMFETRKLDDMIENLRKGLSHSYHLEKETSGNCYLECTFEEYTDNILVKINSFKKREYLIKFAALIFVQVGDLSIQQLFSILNPAALPERQLEEGMTDYF